MSDKQTKFKQIMIAIAIIGVLGTVIPNLMDSSLPVAEKAVICITFLVCIPLLVTALYFVGKKLMKG
ncbi:hypothetical protein MNQ98_18600 [Paenibacillus sp. N3/727]|uniref:hypothetical protein n=1 Tax=Paenibacillus sp. N3/727 TaxID=2925845 RepID=UPI001F53A1C0|nr:hypothetical protein [Paenibacillus sp. N3/727]UNK16505.1 hypothetical protein MNQ98_18600 [Paenibacillus sp. N3/727]